MTEDFKPTEEQLEIVRAGVQTSENLLIEADAGCTKTTTLKLMARAMSPRPLLALAFNKKIAKELEAVMPDWVTVKTFNGLGHGALMKALQGVKITLDDRKIGKLVTELFREQRYEAGEDDWAAVRDWCNAARSAGIVHEAFKKKGLKADTQENWYALSDDAEPNAVHYEFAREVLRRSIQRGLAGLIDYDDQIYLSLFVAGIYPNFANGMVDEFQDLNPLNHIQMQRAISGRLIVAGDRKQSIYGFRGADAEGFEKLKLIRPSWKVLHLHLTFRCPKRIVDRQQEHAPGYAAADSNPMGQVLDWHVDQDGKVSYLGELHSGWDWKWLEDLKEAPTDRVYVICRNTAPLLSLAFKLIRQGVGPNMLGRDIGAGLAKLLHKLDPKGLKDLQGLRDAVQAWMKQEISLAIVNDKEHLVSSIEDKGESLLAVLENESIKNVKDAEGVLSNLFSREYGEVTLGTAHRMKGLESEIVIHLDPFRVPSKWALKRGGRELQQEKNLKYVTETRTRKVFIEAELEGLA